MQTMPAVEGLTPTTLWYTLIGIVGLASLFLLYDKVRTAVRNRQKERENERAISGRDVTDQIAEKVMEKLTPQIDERFDEINEKFADIDRKLSRDREDIARHTRQLDANENRVKKLEDGNHALCHGIFALLSHEVNGNSIDKLKRTQDAMKNYLIDGVYKEENWQ